jgi:branched-chain amino acid transport system ATP-binding protein
MLLDCRGLTVRFGGVLALNALDLTVKRGEIVGLIGPNGSGKTSFFNVISGVYRSDAGLFSSTAKQSPGFRPRHSAAGGSRAHSSAPGCASAFRFSTT